MKRSNRLFLLLGVVLAVVAFAGVMVLGSRGSAPAAAPPPVPMVAVVTANTDIPFGTALTKQMLKTKLVEQTQAGPDTFRDVSEVVGMVVRRPLSKDAELHSRDFGSGGTTSGDQVVRGLEPGRRAVAVQVDRVTGVGALIQPGDRVDVILAIADTDNKAPTVIKDVPGGKARDQTDKISESLNTTLMNNTTVKVLVQNVQVLGSLLPAPESTSNAASSASKGKDDKETEQPEEPTVAADQQQIVIISVTPQQAELVRFAQLDGNLSLALRSPQDKGAEDAATSGITLRKLVDEHGVLPPRLLETDYPMPVLQNR